MASAKTLIDTQSCPIHFTKAAHFGTSFPFGGKLSDREVRRLLDLAANLS
jgi:hypothetical protein